MSKENANWLIWACYCGGLLRSCQTGKDIL